MVSGTIHLLAQVFAVAHTMTGLFALLFEKDLLMGILTDTARFKNIPLTETSDPFFRGTKSNGRGVAPNVRGWGVRQMAIGSVFAWAVYSQQVAAYQAAFLALGVRAIGDAVQNFIDGCMWKVGFFLGVEAAVAGYLIFNGELF